MGGGGEISLNTGGGEKNQENSRSMPKTCMYSALLFLMAEEGEQWSQFQT